MSRVLAIALNGMREHVRDKLLYNLLVFALLLIGSSILLVRLTLGEFERLMLDLGLASINLFGVLIAIFIGIGLVSREIERKTLYTIVSKPIPRYQFLLGKYLGLVATLLLNTAIMTVGLLLALKVMAVPVTPLLFAAVGLIMVELMVMTAVALFFSTFTTPTLSAIFSLAVYVIGHLTADLKALSDKLSATGRAIANGLYYVLPDLERFNLKGHVIHQQAIGADVFTLTIAYGLGWTGLLLILAVTTFQRRDFQ